MTERCSFCGRRLDGLPYKCHRCSRVYCPKHRLPEDHNCRALKEYKKHNQERWANAIHAPILKETPNYSPANYRNAEDYISERQEEPAPYKPPINIRLKKFWWRNRWNVTRYAWKIIKWIIVISLVYLAFNYYQDNKIEVNNFVKGVFNSSTYQNWGAIPHTTPISKSYLVYSEGLNKIELNLHQEVYNYFVNDANHEYTYTTSGSYDSGPPIGWEKDYWRMFISNNNDDYIIKEIVNQTITATKSDGDKSVRAIAMFVQKIPYDWSKLNSNSQYVKYPYETLYTDTGVCAEKALLMAKLLKELGYGVALFSYEKENHMAVGIKCPYDKSNYQTGYCFIEPSDVYPVGYIPQLYVGNIQLKSTPELVYSSEGKAYSK